MISCEIKCPACGRTDSIEEHGTQSTGLSFLPLWCDQRRHIHDPNRYITTFRCTVQAHDGTNECGAIWDIIHTTVCPIKGCSYGDELNERVMHRSRSATEVQLKLRDRMPKLETSDG